MNLINSNEKETRKESFIRFMAMSKFIGLIAFGFAFAITVFAMIEMHHTETYTALPQLIISAFGFASVYAGFYLSMAKVEHVEVEKTRREMELASLKACKASEEDINEKEAEIQVLTKEVNDILIR